MKSENLVTKTDTRRKELGDFLQAIRQRSEPQNFGFPAAGRRRTPGLRREELAQLVSISPTWYTWIEQGRDVNVSGEVLDRLATRLQLTRGERAYLFEVAGRRDPNAHIPDQDDVPSHLLDLLSDITVPAYIMGRYWDLLGWNEPAAELFTGWLDQASKDAEPRPNMLRFVFLLPSTRKFLADWEIRAQRITAEFRADCKTRLDDPALIKLVEEIAAASPEFERFWKQHDVLERRGGQRDFDHPRHGLITYQQITLRAEDREHLKLVMLKPAE